MAEDEAPAEAPAESEAPAAEPEAAAEVAPEGEAAAVEPEKEDPYRDKFVQLQGRFGAMERSGRKSAKQMTDLRARLDQYEAQEKAFTADPLKALEARGVKYETLTKAILNRPDDDEPEDPTKKLEERLAAVEKREQELDQQRVDQAENANKRQLFETLQSAVAKRDDLAITHNLGHHQTLLTRIQSFSTEHGQATNEDQQRIAATLEQELQGVLRKQLTGLMKAPSFRSLLEELTAEDPSDEPGETADAPSDEGEKAPATKGRRPRTVTKAVQAAVSERAPANATRTPEERIAAAAARLDRERAARRKR